MEQKQIHFSISKNLLILVSAIGLAFVFIIACLIVKDGGRNNMMKGKMMRQGDRLEDKGAMMQQTYPEGEAPFGDGPML